MSLAAGKTKDILYYINSAIALLLMFFFGKLPPIGEITAVGMQVAGVFLGLLWAWTFVDLLWTSLIGIVALGFTDYTTVAAAFTAGFGNANVLLVLFCLLFGAYMDTTGINKFIANWFITRKICQGRPWVFTFMFLLASYFLALTISVFATIILMWSLFYNVCEIVGYKKEDKYTALMIVGLCYAASLGVTPKGFNPLPVMVLTPVQNMLGISVDLGSFAILTLIVSLPCLVLYWLAMKFIFRPDMSLLVDKMANLSVGNSEKMNKEQKIAFVVLIIFFVMMFLPSFISKTGTIGRFLNTFGTTGAAAFLVGCVCAIKIDGKRLADFTELVHKGVSWDLIVLFAVTMPLGSAITNEQTGILAFVSAIFKPMLDGTSPLMFSIILLVGACFITQFAHNLVLGAVFAPIMCTFVMGVGANPQVLAVLLSFVLALALATPAGSAMSAMIFGNKNWIDAKEAYKYTWVTFFIVIFCTIVIGIPAGNLIF